MPDVVLPVLDEREALPWVLGRMPAGYRADRRRQRLDRRLGRAGRSGSARSVVHEPQRGFGAACWAGLTAAHGDVVCFMDCDGSLDPRELPRVADPVSAGRADLVLGARAPRAGRLAGARAGRRTRVLAWELRRRARGAARATSARCALPGASALLALGISDRRFGWPLEMVLRAAEGRLADRRGRRSTTSRAPGRSKVTGTVRGTLRAVRDMAAVLR